MNISKCYVNSKKKSVKKSAKKKLNELDQNHGGIVAVAIAELDDAGVTARTIGVTFCDIVEKFFEDGVVILGIFSIRAIDGALVKASGNDAASVDIIAFCTFSDRDKLIDDGTKFFSFGLGGHNGFVIEKLRSEILEHLFCYKLDKSQKQL